MNVLPALKKFDVLFKTKGKGEVSYFKGNLFHANIFFTRLSTIEPVILSVKLGGIKVSPRIFVEQMFTKQPEVYTLKER